MPTQKNTHINKHPAKASTALPLPPLPTHSLDNLSPTPHTYLQPSRKVKGKAGHVSDKHPRSRHSAPNGLEPPHPIQGTSTSTKTPQRGLHALPEGSPPPPTPSSRLRQPTQRHPSTSRSHTQTGHQPDHTLNQQHAPPPQVSGHKR